MKKAIRDYKTKDLTKFVIKNKNTLDEAVTQIRAQINKWLEDHNEKTYSVNSILMNKLVYFISQEVNKTNNKFILDRGWYIYGPCYEEGRWLEVNNTPITFKLIATETTQEVDKVCSELFPKFRDFERRGKVLEEFLRYIYKNKCDKKDFQEFYITKHDLWCLIYDIKESNFNYSEKKPIAVRQTSRNFEKIFYDEKYARLVKLSKNEIDDIHKYLDIQIEYINFILDEQRTLPMGKDIFDVYMNTILNGLSHLNYAETFESFNTKFKREIEKTHTKKGHLYLSGLKEANRRLSKELFNLMYYRT